MVVYISSENDIHRQSYERYNIELRTGVDIREITVTDCKCKDHKKISKFSIDTEKVDLDDYISKNNFMLIDDLYIKKNDNKNLRYKVVFDKKNAELIINLTYKNN
jgi:hypothetical protein